ncbi:hypothetical protein HY571_01985 [Candidatus Micrarchaeota archaeon]|nr:hypothetical protein [Candidatus Micrarchaeota archaeon]
MGIEEVERIKNLLEQVDAEFRVIRHEPVRTSEDAARVRKAPLHEGIKAIVVKERKRERFCVADVPADKKIDMKKLAKVIGASLTLASPEEVLGETGCEVGGVPPLGHKKSLKILVDNENFANEYNEFNAGLTTTSIRVRTTDLKKVFEKLGATMGEFSKQTTSF